MFWVAVIVVVFVKERGTLSKMFVLVKREKGGILLAIFGVLF